MKNQINTAPFKYEDMFSDTHKKIYDHLRDTDIELTHSDIEYLYRATTFYSKALFDKYGNQLSNKFRKILKNS